MSYGLIVQTPTWPIPINLSAGWLPSFYVGDISINISGSRPGPVTVNFTVPHADTVLFIVPSTKTGNAYSYSGTGIFWYTDCIITGHQATVSTTYLSYISSMPTDQVTYQVYGYLPAASDPSGYGIQFLDSGADTMFLTSTVPNVARWKIEAAVGQGRTLEYDTSIPDTEATPCPFISDTGHNAIACYMFKSGGSWWVRVQRLYPDCNLNQDPFGEGYINRAPYAGTIRVIVFTQYDGSESDYGMSLYGADGTRVYSTVAPPLMLRRQLTLPAPTYIVDGTIPRISDNAGDQFTAAELALEPMINGVLQGILRLNGRYHWECSSYVSPTGKYTVGTNRYAVERNFFGTSHGWWGPSYTGATGTWVAGTDYF